LTIDADAGESAARHKYVAGVALCPVVNEANTETDTAKINVLTMSERGLVRSKSDR